MRRVVVWAIGRGKAADGMACAIREDGGDAYCDACSVTGTRSHAVLAIRAHVRLKACVIPI